MFSNLFLDYLKEQKEEYLFAIADYGKQLLKSNVPPEDIAEIFEDAILKAAQEFPQASLLDIAPNIATPLSELLIGYGLSFREQNELKKQQEELKEIEMSRAKQIYELVLQTNLPVLSGIVINVECIPAENVGGDVFEMIQLDSDRIILFIGDVTGHGMAAALTANTLKILFKDISMFNASPAYICQRLNQIMHKSILPDDIIAAFCCLFDIKSMTLKYCLAGIPSPIILRDQDKIILKPTDIPLGVIGDLIYNEQTIKIQDGDLFLAFTDGLNEARNKNGDLFKYEKIKRVLDNLSSNVYLIVNNLIDEVILFQNKKKFNDDVIILAINFLLKDSEFKFFNKFSTSTKSIFSTKTKSLSIDDFVLGVMKHIQRVSQISETNFGELKITFSELLTNAFEHGNLELSEFKNNFEIYSSEAYQQIYENRRNSEKYGDRKIIVECMFRPNEIEISIEDEGNGFNPNSVEDPRIAENRYKLCGRGIFLAKKYAENIVYSQKGNIVRLFKKI
ncbi:MAG: SpoIIE family protein phosphatase [Desulfobacterales bacterium]|nr:SpoIIE family protein phosphatase [Desulfobacterales bacterium]